MSVNDASLARNRANHRPLTPISFLEWAATVYPETTAIIYGDMKRDYSAFYERCCRLAGALHAQGVERGDVVAILAPNTPAMLEAHYAVPMLGAVLCPISTLKDADAIAYVVDHSDAKVVLVDAEFAPRMREALGVMAHSPLIVDIADEAFPKRKTIGTIKYEALIESGCANFDWQGPEDEWDAISLNYTLGTVDRPKGVLFHHRGAYLDATGDVISSNLRHGSTYLWTLPMPRANGWCYSWAVTAVGGTHVCLRDHRDIKQVYALINAHKVTHLSGKKGFLEQLAKVSSHAELPHTVHLDVVETNMDPELRKKVEEKGFDVTYLYGLMETFGPAAICDWHAEGSVIGTDHETLLAHPAAHYPTLEQLDVVDPETMEPVAHDGESVGEVVVRGNTVFKGYYKDPEATEAAFRGGVLHTGDLGKLHPDGHLEIVERCRTDVPHMAEALTNNELAAEEVIKAHPSVSEAIVLHKEGSSNGLPPILIGYVVLNDYAKDATRETIMEYCREQLPANQMPRELQIKEALPKTEDGEICRYQLQQDEEVL